MLIKIKIKIKNPKIKRTKHVVPNPLTITEEKINKGNSTKPHSLMGVLFTLPSRYYFTIGHPGVFSLTRWSLLIHTGFHVPHATRVRA